MKTCVVLKNYHVNILSLRKEDGIIKTNYCKRMNDKFNCIKIKHKPSVKAHYEKKQARQRIENELLGDIEEAHNIACPVEDDLGNPNCEG